MASLVDLLGRRVQKPIKLSQVAAALDQLGPDANQVLQEMQEKGLGLEDPVAYINAKAQRKALTSVKSEGVEDDDDVSKLTKRITWLNKFGSLAKPVKVTEVVGALYCLGLAQSMAILRGLQERGGSVKDPTACIKLAVQRANGVVAAKTEAPDEEYDEEGEEGDEALLEEAAALAEGYDEAEGDEYGDENNELMDEAAALAAGYEEPEEEEPKPKRNKSAPLRVVGAITGTHRLVPTQAEAQRKRGPNPESLVKDEEVEGETGEKPVTSQRAASLPITPQEKIAQCRNLARKNGLELDEMCLKSLARLPFYRAKDLIDDVVLGGRNRTGVSNPSRYLTLGVQKMHVGLGVEQGIAMELAVSVGVVLNNDALDELASIPRKEAHSVIRALSKDQVARADPMSYIKGEVERVRASMEATPFPGGAR